MAAFEGGSLVSNIIQKASALDDRVIEDSVQKLTKKSNQLKGEIYELVKKQYVEFDSYVSSAVSFEQQLKEVTSEYKRLSNRIDQELNSRVTKSLDKRQEIESKLIETRHHITFVQNLVSIHYDLEKSRTDLQSEKFISAAEHLRKVAKSLEEIGKKGCEAKVYQALKTEMEDVVSNLSINLCEQWYRFVCWSPKVIPDDPKLETLLSFELSVPIRSESSDKHMEEVIIAMQVLTATELWRQMVTSFGKKLLKVVVKALITRGLKIVLVEEEVAFKLKMVKMDTDSQPSQLYELFESLMSMFLYVRKIVPSEHQAKWMAGVGEVVCSEMAELVVAHSLSTSIPKTSTELRQYSGIETKTLEFESRVVQMGLVEEGSFHRLSDYTKDVNTHFAAQISQEILVKARSILMKPIHNGELLPETSVFERLAQLGPGSDSTSSLPSETASFKKTHSKEEDLTSLTFTFPSCVVSQSVMEFIDLLYATLNDCSKSSTPSMAVHLFYTTRKMVDLFCAVLPSYHSSTIGELPRVAAVQHNNCMYVAHHLITLGHQFHSKIPPPLNSEVTTFVDQVPLVRQLGEECYLTEMRKQCNCILEYLKPFGGLDNVSMDSQSQLVRQGIKQVLLHLNSLSKVYAEVLPKEIHHKAMGALLNVLNSEMIKRVLALEDISVDDTTELHSILNMLLEKGPSCVVVANSEEDATVYCTSIPKVNELAIMLDASMQEIVDRWNTDDGALAKHFTAIEVRGFIKAVFKNTERRANAVAKITV